MTEPKEKKASTETIDESTPQDLPEPIANLKRDIETRIEAESIGAEFLDKLKDVAISRRQLREAETDIASSLTTLQTIVNTLSGKIDDLAELKKSNLALEQKVLKHIEETLKQNK
jgi:hypothetical protein